MHLNELLSIADCSDRNRQLKRAFNGLQNPIAIDGKEVDAIHILANLTCPLTKLKDATDAKNAKLLIHDSSWLDNCANTTQFIHSHNLKYPNYRIQGVIRLQPVGELPIGYLSSAIISDTRLGWSHNSKYINFQLFFGAYFVWQDRTVTIHQLISEHNILFRELLFSAGMFKKDYGQLQSAFKKWKFEKTIKSLHEDIRQVRVPYKQEYIALTPVPAHTMQRDIHLALSKNNVNKTTVSHSRAASVGSLVSAAAGKVFALNSQPKRLLGPHTIQGKSFQTRELSALESLLNSDQMLLTPNIKQAREKKLRKRVQDFLGSWMQLYAPEKSIDKCIELFHYYLSKTKSWRHLAYNPEVTRVVRSLFTINDVGMPLAKTTTITDNSQYRYLLLPALSVSNANAINSAYSVGLPSIIGIWGFLHAFERNVQQYCVPEFKLDGFAICLHQFSLHNRGLTREEDLKNGKLVTPAILPTRQCDLELSIVIKCRVVKPLSEQQILACLPNTLCQGAIYPAIKNIEHFKMFENLLEAAQATPTRNGCWLTKAEMNTEVDLNGWLEQKSLLICNVGYHFLEQPTNKTNTINELSHCFAEPVLAQLKEQRLHATSDESDFFWVLRQLDNAVILDSWSNNENSK